MFMCRIAAYLGPPLKLSAFIRHPEHSLYRQSWAAKELITASVNADGYGVGWLDENNQPALYRNIMPVWADPNLPSLERSLRSRLWLGNVRSATEGLATHLDNTQPYTDTHRLFTHNGFIHNFAKTARQAIRAELDPDIEASINGNTDSEYLFALLRQQRAPVHLALQQIYTWLNQHLAGSQTEALLNIIVSDGRCLAAMRSAINGHCPSLYFHPQHPQMAHGMVIASEAFDTDPGWQPVPEQHVIELVPNQPAALHRL